MPDYSTITPDIIEKFALELTGENIGVSFRNAASIYRFRFTPRFRLMDCDGDGKRHTGDKLTLMYLDEKGFKENTMEVTKEFLLDVKISVFFQLLKGMMDKSKTV